MQLKLAIAQECRPQSLRVQLAGLGGELEASYSRHVLDQVKIRPGDMVAIDISVNPPEAVWRWWRGTVEAIGDGLATVRRNTSADAGGGPRTGTMQVLVAAEVGLVLTGDTVYFGGDPQRIVAVAMVTGPREAESVAASVLPGVMAAYGPN